jgi:hypothetical protein
VLGHQLGSGVQGIVFNAKSQVEEGRSALKVHKHPSGYGRERDAYLRLRDLGINTILDCHVPEMLGYDDDLWIIEMTVVTRPFVLDFGGAFLDQPPDFSDEVLSEWRAGKMEQFGKRWPMVERILRFLGSLGIYVSDVNPNNISWPE